MAQKIYQGSSKTLYASEEEYTFIMAFEDSLRLANGENMVATGKGSINNTISTYLMQKLDLIGVENHLIKKLNMHKSLIQQTDVYPVQIYVTNVASGRYVSDFGIEEGFVFEGPLLDFRVKNSKLGYPAVNEQQIINFDWMNRSEIKEISKIALRVHDFLVGMFAAVGIRMVEVKLEFGAVFNGEDFTPILIDEISPDTCRLWDMDSNQKLCFESASQGPEQLIESYQEVLHRLGV